MKDCDLLGSIGRQSFLESYRSEPKGVILNYMNLKVTLSPIETALEDVVLYQQEAPMGSFKII